MPVVRGSSSCPGAAAGTAQPEPMALVIGSSTRSPAQWDECLAVLQESVQPTAGSHFPLQLTRVHAGRGRAVEDSLCGSIELEH